MWWCRARGRCPSLGVRGVQHLTPKLFFELGRRQSRVLFEKQVEIGLLRETEAVTDILQCPVGLNQ